MTNTVNKRIFAIFMTLVLVFMGMSQIEVSAQGEQNVRLNGSNEDYSWTEKEDGTLEITSYNGIGGDIKIPSTILGKRVTSIGKFAFEYVENITNVEIPESVMSIGIQAFNSCSSLVSVEISEGVKDIGNNAFSSCRNLTDVKIPGSVLRIGELAFAGCKKLTNVGTLGNATIIEDGAFAGCSSLTNMKITNGNENYILENGILYDKQKTKVVFCLGGTTGEVRISEGVAKISDYAFSGCSMTNVKIPESVTNIEEDAFSYCDALRTVEIPKNAMFIGEGAFSYCNSLENVVISGNMMDIGISAFRSCRKITNVEIREGVASIASFAFSDCSSLANLDLSKSVKSIGFGAFLGCSSLESVRIPDSVTNIGESAFSECSGLTKVEIPDSVENIGGGTFRECSSLKSIIIPKTVTSIGSSAFSGCSSLANVEIQEGVTSIGSSAFSNCDSLINIEIPTSVEMIGSSAFYYCRNFKSIKLPDSITEIKSNTFSNCSKLNNITIPDSVIVIAKDAFQGINMRAVTIICSQGSYAEQYARENNFAVQDISGTPEENPGTETPNEEKFFYKTLEDGTLEITGYSGEKTDGLIIPDSIDGKAVSRIGDEAFKRCSGQVSGELKLPDSLRSIGSGAFEGCSGLRGELKLPDRLQSISFHAFYGCSGLRGELKLPNNLASIGVFAFWGCSGLSGKLELPESLTEVGGGAFSCGSGITQIETSEKNSNYSSYDGCLYNKEKTEIVACPGGKTGKINLPESLTSIGVGAFEGCSGLRGELKLPQGITRIGAYAFEDCSGFSGELKLPEELTNIESFAFYGCNGLTSVVIPSKVTDIAQSTFGECGNLKSITIPDSVKNIDSTAFYNANPALAIICSQGSYAEQYAKENNFAIKYVQGTPDQNPTEKPGTETPGTPGQNPTEKPGDGSADKPAVSPDGKTVQTITAEDIVKTLGDAPFYLDAETDGDGTLTYESKNPDIVKVDGTGKATIISAGTAKISVTASATGSCSSAKKVVTVTVIPEGYTAISDIADLYAIRNNPGGNYILVNDIDMSATQKGGVYDFGRGWTPIEKFYGTLDGNGHRMIGMHIFGEFGSDEDIGLFGKCTGNVINLGVVECDVDINILESSSFINVGIFAGESDSQFKQCYVQGKITVRGKEYCSIGGMVGNGYSTGHTDYPVFYECYNFCDIDCSQLEAQSEIGGICRTAQALRRCYNVGNIRGNEQSEIGAICCSLTYNGVTDNCRYLRGTAQQGVNTEKDNPNCVSLTEAQMKNPKLFTGFDFANTWEIDPYCSYPYPQLKNNRMVRINSIQLKTAPTKLTYSQGESLRLNGAALELSYEDGINTTIPLEKDMLSGYNMNRIGRQTVTVSYGGEETSFDIEVKEVQVSGISIPKTLSLNRSKQKQLTASITPANASNKSITWESDNPGVASVNSSGLVKAKAKGRVVITATASNGIQAKCTVTVLVPAVSVKLSHSSLSMAAGSRRSIKAQLLPLESTDSVNWKSSNKAVAEVYGGSVLAKKEGTAKITAYTKSGAKAFCTVTVKKSGGGSSSEIKKVTSKKAKIKSAKNAKKRSVTLKLSGSVNGGGYKIQYGTSRKFKGAKTVTVKGNTASIKKLKAKKTYYIRARIYKKISGKTYYGKWSGVKSVKIKK